MHPVVMVRPHVNATKAVEVICHRHNRAGVEEYLLRWVSSAAGPSDTPFSWHSVDELETCLILLQEYLESLLNSRTASRRKRKRQEAPRDEPRLRNRLSTPNSRSTSDRSSSTPTSTATTATAPSSRDSKEEINIYNGVLRAREGVITAVPSKRPDIARIDVRDVPTPSMTAAAKAASTMYAQQRVRDEVLHRLAALPGPTVSLVNSIDTTSPPLNFQFIRKNILGEGVYAADPATRTGCTKCAPHMGQGIGCEYSKVCDCLEYAAVNETERMLPEEKARWEKIKETGEGDTAGLPKKFPYYSSGVYKGCLVPFYLERRFPIYECNENCRCGPGCKTRVVQFGRQVKLEIFRTRDGRGWGLRCKERLLKGQFIDTYRGEIITDAEATRREKHSIGSKNSYLYSLDKFADTLGLEQEDLYVIDGQYKGGPTRFINHSCEPNCRQYVVSYNKHDPKVYEIAFFATRDIAAGQELTFDYLDKDDDEDEDVVNPEERKEGGVKPTECRCGSKRCRKWLWM